jgi:hypothetical protein
MGGYRGNLIGGPQQAEASLEQFGDIGESMSIFLAQDMQSVASWLLTVRAQQMGGGAVVVGQVRCRAPSQAGEPASRLVATCYCPGAIGWSLSGKASNVTDGASITAESAFVSLHTSINSGALPGVRAAPPLSGSPEGNRHFLQESNIIQSPVSEMPGGSTLWQIEGNIVEQAAPESVWVMLFDQNFAPNPGQVPLWAQHCGEAAANAPPDPSRWQYRPGPMGRLIAGGLWVSLSTSGVNLVPAALHTSVTTEFSPGGL